jgi:hypothetical protein
MLSFKWRGPREKYRHSKPQFNTAERLELKVGVSEELFEKLKRVQDLVSQKTQDAASLEDAFAEMAELYLEKNDPTRKVARARFRITMAESVSDHSTQEGTDGSLQLCPGPVLSSEPVRKRIPNATRHALNARDQGQCTHVGKDGNRCAQRRWTQIHHRTAVSQGGTNDLRNLATLCFQHHRFVHTE